MNRTITRRYRKANIGDVAMPICITGVEGNDLIDAEGNWYLDFSSGSGVVNAGWQRTEVARVVQAQVDRLSYCPPWFPSEEAVKLSELLVSITPSHLTKCGRATGGADANELICRAAYAYTGKPGVLSLSRAYHGGSRLAGNLSDEAAFRLPLIPIHADCHKAEAPHCFRCPLHLDIDTCGVACTSLVEDTIENNPDIGLFLCEPVLGSGGVILRPPDYLQRVQEICRSHDVVFALDEVMTGFGRRTAVFMRVVAKWTSVRLRRRARPRAEGPAGAPLTGSARCPAP